MLTYVVIVGLTLCITLSIGIGSVYIGTYFEINKYLPADRPINISKYEIHNDKAMIYTMVKRDDIYYKVKIKYPFIPFIQRKSYSELYKWVEKNLHSNNIVYISPDYISFDYTYKSYTKKPPIAYVYYFLFYLASSIVCLMFIFLILIYTYKNVEYRNVN